MLISRSSTLVLVLAGLAALAPFAIDTYLPAFHVMAAEFGTDELAIQQSLTLYLLPYAVMTLCHGAISDAIGRITTIKWGLAIFALASLGCAMVRDLFSGAQAQRVMATVQLLFGIAPAVAPILGGVLLGIHWQAIFIFLSVYAAIALWMAVRYLPETMTPEKRIVFSVQGIIATYGKMLKHKVFLGLIACLGLNFSAFFIYVLASPVFLVKHLHLNSQQFGYLFIPTVTGMMLGSWISRHTAGKVAPARILYWAFAWMVLIASCNVGLQWWASASVHSAWWLAIVPIALFNVGMAAAMPVLSIAALDCYPALRGTAASAQAFMQMLCSTLSSALIVPLVWHSTLTLAAAMLAMTLLSSLLLLLARQSK